MRSTSLIHAATSERRKRARVPLVLTVYLSNSGDTNRLETKTRDISSAGFYCLVPMRFEPGQELECSIMLPPSALNPHQVLYLQCRAKVIRIENGAANGWFGIGCQIEEYHVHTFEDLD